MRILCLAYIEPGWSQLMTKFDKQVAGLLRLERDCHAVVFGSQELVPNGSNNFQYVRMPWNMASYCAAADAIAQTLLPDIIYFRYPCANEHLLRFVKRHGNVVFEHNTKELEELKGLLLQNEEKWGAAVLSHAAGCVAVTPEILDYERKRAGRENPGVAIGNGIDLASLAPLDFSIPADTRLHILCAASFSPWHATDRLIEGMAMHPEPRRFLLHLAGNGREYEQLRQIVVMKGLTDCVEFHGFLDSEALSVLAARCHVGAGTLGLHRLNMKECTTLKHRQYCLQGLPFFFAGNDTDFLPLPDFVHLVPLNDSPIDLEGIKEWALHVLKNPNLRREMHRYAEERLSWEKKSELIYKALKESLAALPASPHKAAHGMRLSIIVCCTQGLTGFDGTVAGIASQTPPAERISGIEIVVVADAATLEAARGTASLHAELPFVFVPSSDSHLAAMRNAGIAAACGQWILPVEAGDVLLADVPSALLAALEARPELNVLTGQAVDASGNSWRPLYTRFRGIAHIEPPGMMLFRKSLWEDMGGYAAFVPWEEYIDYSWLLRLSFPDVMPAATLSGVCLQKRDCSAARIPVQNMKEASALLRTHLPYIDDMESMMQSYDILRALSPATKERIRDRLASCPEAYLPAFWMGLSESQNNLSESLKWHLKAHALCDDTEWQPALQLRLLYLAMKQKTQAKAFENICRQRNRLLAVLFDALWQK
ncbi:MAG: hypothetical protein FWH34_01175 [Desulfovibrionaceae bacterium]|nr:hypothetical protein [Desulfovibrionaceae bacterium]